MIRQALRCEREILKKFVCDAHIAKSGFSEQAIEVQLEDLPNDFPELYDEELWDPTLCWIYCEVDQISCVDDIHGCVGVRIVDKKTVYLIYLYINETRRGSGLGRKLLRQALKWADDYTQLQEVDDTNLVRSVTLYTLKNIMTSAISLYVSEGFQVIGEQPFECFCVLTMKLDLDQWSRSVS